MFLNDLDCYPGGLGTCAAARKFEDPFLFFTFYYVAKTENQISNLPSYTQSKCLTNLNQINNINIIILPQINLVYKQNCQLWQNCDNFYFGQL